METLRIGSEGSAVITLQHLLQKNGYGVNIDGKFGDSTETAIISFQKNNFLSDDGIVGTMTWNTLLKIDNKDKTINSTKYVLPNKNYYAEPKLKKAIVLHHTNGWTVVKDTADMPSMNHFNWWKSTDVHVSTAFSIDYKGNIYQHFDPKFWAYHLGLGSAKDYMDKYSIGIEITNEGGLTKEADGSFLWYSGSISAPYNRPNDQPIEVKEGWRGFNWFAPYSEEQYESALWLVKYLCNEFNIKKNFISDCNYHPELLDGKFEGIFTHTNVRDYPETNNKWDLSPAFPFKKFLKDLNS